MRKNITLVIMLLGLLSFLWIINLGDQPRGTDNQAVSLIEEINPGYSPWFQLPWQQPDERAESLLFTLQAATGTGLVCLLLGYLIVRNKRKVKS